MMTMRVGEVTTMDDQPGTACPALAVVIGETNRADCEERLRVMGEAHLIPRINADRFYRMVAE